ncbi:MAG: trehalose-phosphatase [Gemmatimonadaceae bacterium]
MLAEVHRACVARRRGTRLVLLSDFDGTLAEFDLDPTLPRIRSDAFAALVALSSLSHVTLGLVSGRRVADLARRVPLGSDVYLAGLHGLEIAIGDRRWEHRAVHAAQAAARALELALDPVVARTPGARLESKGPSVAVHVRGVGRDQRAGVLQAADDAAAPWLASGALKRLRGADVHEFLPAAAWTKGDAVRWIVHDVERLTGQPAWVVYFGDDLTDEDAFRAIDEGVSVVVGRRASTARYRLESTADVAAVLLDVAEAAAAEAHP